MFELSLPSSVTTASQTFTVGSRQLLEVRRCGERALARPHPHVQDVPLSLQLSFNSRRFPMFVQTILWLESGFGLSRI